METTAEARERWQEADERVAQALEEREGARVGGGAQVDPAAAEAAVVKCLGANHANTLALLACLRACDVPTGEERPYREVEEQVASDPAMGLTMQTPHTLIGMLVKAGGIARTMVGEDEGAPAAVPALGADAAENAPAESGVESSGPAEAAYAAAADQAPTAVPAVEGIAGAAGEAAGEADHAGVPDGAVACAGQPVDYTLRTTDAGRAALAAFDPAARFGELIASEPQGYLDAYARVLDACSAPEGATRAAVEEALAGHPALTEPKRIYPGYFISKLETVGGLSWDGAWHATAAGERMLAAFA